MMMTTSRSRRQQEGTSRLDRKTIEKNRRLHMKGLCFKLAAILPKDTAIPTEALTQLDYLDQATCYIKHLHEKLETLKERRRRRETAPAPAAAGPGASSSSDGAQPTAPAARKLQLPVLDVRDLGTSLETVLICSAAASDSGTGPGFLFYDVVAALEEEGAHVVNASYSLVNTKMFFTIHSQIPLPRVGTEAARVTQRLKKLLAC